MTTSIKEREGKLCDRELQSEDQKLSLKTKNCEPARALEAKEESGERQVGKDEDGIVFDRDTDGQEQRLAERCSAGAREAIAETAKLADQDPKSLTQREKTWTDATRLT